MLPLALGEVAAHARRQRRLLDQPGDVLVGQAVGADVFRRRPAGTAARQKSARISARSPGRRPGRWRREEPRPISTSRQPVLPRSVSSRPSSKNSIQPPAEAVLGAAVEADDFRAPQAAGEAEQQDRAVAQAPEVAEIERRDHGEEVLRQHRLFLLGRPALGAADAGEHGGDMAVGAVECLAALGEIPHQRRKPALDRGDRARFRPAAAPEAQAAM